MGENSTDDFLEMDVAVTSPLPEMNSELFKNMSKDLNLVTFALISNRALQFVFTINYSIMCASISIFGIVANAVNIIVFIKMKFSNTINIALLALSISDLASLMSLLWTCICFNPLFMYSDLPINTFELQIKTGTWTHFIFTRVTAFITVYITLERCVCILYPLKVKQILTHKRVVTIIVCIFALVLLGMTPNYGTVLFAWKFNPRRNKTVLGFVFTEHRLIVETFSYYVNVLFLCLAFIGVLAFSSILIQKLNQRSKWLGNITSSHDDVKTLRDRQVVKMVTWVAVIFIVSHIPSVLNFMTAAMEPEFGFRRKFGNVFLTAGSIALTCDAINSSSNIFIYYKMSSKYWRTFRSLLYLKNENDDQKE